MQKAAACCLLSTPPKMYSLVHHAEHPDSPVICNQWPAVAHGVTHAFSLVSVGYFATCSESNYEVHFGISGRMLVLKEDLLLELK